MYDENYTVDWNPSTVGSDQNCVSEDKKVPGYPELMYNDIDFLTIINKNKSVNHPTHYNSGKIEVIDFIEDQKLGFHLGNAVKYISRAGKKDPAKVKEDLEKAIWYIQRYIEKIQEEKK